MTDGDMTSIQVRAAAGGDADATAWIVERFTPLLRAQARYRLGPGLRRLCDPDDLVQEVWAVAWPALPTLAEGAERAAPVLQKFLTTTLLFRANNLARAHIRGRGRSASLGSQSLAALPASSRGVVTRVVRSEARDRLLAAVEALGDRDREVVVLRGIEQRPNAEVAALLGETPNAVSLRYNRALAALRASGGMSATELFENS